MHLTRRQTGPGARAGATMRTVRLVGLTLLVITGTLAFREASATSGAATPAARALDPSLRPARTTAQLITRLQRQIRETPTDVDGYAVLGEAYLQRVRETGDPVYYRKAEAVLAAALKRDPRHVETLIGAGALALARHDFRAALAIGERAHALNPTIPRIYGIIGDAQVELGLYAAAARTVQTMVDMRPDLSSYSRASYLRELYGRVPGAIAAMRLAVEAGAPNAENAQWVRVQLGNLYVNQGDLGMAERQYRDALAQLPGYVHALAGLAQVRAAQGRYRAAIDLYTQAIQRMPLPQYVIALGDVYARTGDHGRAEQQYRLVRVIDQLLTANGVNTDLETALFFADHGIDLPASLHKARAAYAARRSIQTADGLAWTLYKTGRYREARRYATEALALGTRDALKIFHAGMVARALGQTGPAETYLRRAVGLNPHFSLLYGDVAATTLRELDTSSGRKP